MRMNIWGLGFSFRRCPRSMPKPGELPSLVSRSLTSSVQPQRIVLKLESLGLIK